MKFKQLMDKKPSPWGRAVVCLLIASAVVGFDACFYYYSESILMELEQSSRFFYGCVMVAVWMGSLSIFLSCFLFMFGFFGRKETKVRNRSIGQTDSARICRRSSNRMRRIENRGDDR